MKQLFICDHCGFPIEAVLYPPACPQCSTVDNCYMNASYHPASEEERLRYNHQTFEHLSYSLAVIKDVYGEKTAKQIRKLFLQINSAETGDDVDIRIERDSFLQYCLDRARLGEEFADAEKTGDLKWYQDNYPEDYRIWKSGKPVPLRLDRFSFYPVPINSPVLAF